MSSDNNNEMYKAELLKSMSKAQKLNDKTMEVTPEQLVMMVASMRGYIGDVYQELCATQSVVALQVAYIKKLEDQIKMYKVKYEGADAESLAAEQDASDRELDSLVNLDVQKEMAAQQKRLMDKETDMQAISPRRMDRTMESFPPNEHNL